MYRVGKRITFDAAHQLPGDPQVPLHGHTYTVEVVLAAADLSGPGFVLDFGEFKPVSAYIRATLDHRLLNDVLTEPDHAGVVAHLRGWCDEHLPLPARVVVDGIGLWTTRDKPVRRPRPWVGRFDAAHFLPGLPDWHKCGRMHGHSYAVHVDLVNSTTKSRDRALAPLGDYLRSLDMGCLNDMLDAPTSERLAAHLHRWCTEHVVLPGGARLAAVTVSETASTWAQYRWSER